jgi:hypothetical protein
MCDLVRDRHAALLLGHSCHGADVANPGCRLPLEDGEARLGLDNLQVNNSLKDPKNKP